MGRWTGNAQWIFAGILPLLLGLAALRVAHYRTDRKHLLQDQAERFRSEYEARLECHQARALFAFRESVDQPQVLAQLHDAWDAPDEAVRAVHRERLQTLLEPTFAHLQSAGFRQFHFHFPDCTSFLRVHRPERFGDSLAEVRETVVAVNRDHVPIIGFEEGRIANAYRNVFPLFYRGEHVGSVEISFSIQRIGTALHERLGGRHQMIMSRDVVQRKLFTEERTNYADWPWSDLYLLDTEASHAPLFPEDGAIPDREGLARRIEAGLQEGKDFGLILRLEGRSHILQFTAIRNFMGRQVAYWVCLHESRPLEELWTQFRGTMAIFLLGILLSAAGLFWMWRLQRKLKVAESFLPVCATCKKVRPVDADPDDPRSWISLEEYFTRHTDERLTHGMCPECFGKVIKENEL